MAGIDGSCPKCQKGQINQVEEAKPAALRYGNLFRSTYRMVYRCDNPDCDYQNIAMGVVV